MTSNRRTFLSLSAGAAASGLAWPGPARAARGTAKALLFDAFVIFDPRPVAGLAEELFPGKGAALVELWRNRQFEYAWLRVVSQHYEDFGKVSGDALDFASTTLKMELTPSARSSLMGTFHALKPWPDVPPALGQLAEAGIRLGFVSNLTPRMLESSLGASGLRHRFEHVLSTDRARTYKPDPRAYQLGLDAFGTRREETVFAASAGWDAAGAKWFGYPTFWSNRTGQAAEGLDATPDATGRSMADLIAFVRS